MALGVDVGQLLVQCGAVGVGAQGFLEDFLGLQVAAIGQVDIGLGHGVHIARIKLAGRVVHGGAGQLARCAGVHALAAAGAKEGVGCKLAVAKGAFAGGGSGTAALHDAVAAISQQQGQQGSTGQRDGGIFQQRIDEAGLGDRCSGNGCRLGLGWLGWSRCGGSGFCGSRRCGSCRRCGVWCCSRGRSRCGGRIGGSCRGRCLGRCRFRRRRHGRCAGHGHSSCLAASGSRRRCRSTFGGLGGGGDLAQLGHVALQLGRARCLVFRLLLLGQAFVRLHALDGALGQGELVGCCGGRLAVFDLGLDAARCFAVGGGHGCGRRSAGQLAAELVEIAGLGGNDLARFARRGGLGRGFVRHGEHGAGAHAVHIAVDEDLGIGAQHGHQHLVQRNAGRQVGGSDAACRVPGLDADFGCVGWRRGRCGALAGCRGGTALRCWRRAAFLGVACSGLRCSLRWGGGCAARRCGRLGCRGLGCSRHGRRELLQRGRVQ